MSGEDNAFVSLGQVAQMFAALAAKSWGRRELTLMGQATPAQLEDLRLVLQGRVRVVPVSKRWWREGDDIIISPTEDRSGRELLAQEPQQFGSYMPLAVKELLPKVSRMTDKVEFVIVRCQYSGATYEEVLGKMLESRPDLEMAPASATLVLSADDVKAMDLPGQLIIGHSPLNWSLTNTHTSKEIFCWDKDLWTKSTGVVGYNPTPWMQANEDGYSFLLKRKEKVV